MTTCLGCGKAIDSIESYCPECSTNRNTKASAETQSDILGVLHEILSELKDINHNTNDRS